MTDWTRAAIGLALALAASAPAALRAENAPPAAQNADPVYDGQKAVFEACRKPTARRSRRR